MQTTNTATQRAKRLRSRGSRFTSKVGRASKVFALLAGLSSSSVFGSTSPSPELRLSCSVHSDNFGTEPGLLTSKNVSIGGSVLAREGRSLVYETEDLAFWALAHMTQELNDDHFINSFEVAIHEKSTDRFYNALSDSVFSPDQTPTSARIRLTNYHPGTFYEEGYIIFECQVLTTTQQ